MESRHKDIVRRLYDEVWTQAEFGDVHSLHASKLMFHIRGMSIELGPERLVEIVSAWKQAFPDLRFDVEAMVAEGDMVAARVVYTGTHRGEWKQIPPTGKRVEVHEMLFFRFENERIAEVWEVPDEFSLRQQLQTEND